MMSAKKRRDEPQQSANRNQTRPHNLEAERALLGSILLDNTSLNFALEILGKDDFYSEAHRITFEKMSAISEKNRVIDLVTLSDELDKDGLLEKAGGAGYLAALTDGVPIGTTVAMGEYCRIVKDRSTARQLLNVGNSIVLRCMSGSEEAPQLLETAQTEVFELAARRTSAGLESARKIFKENIGSIDKLFERGRSVTGVETGLIDLDTITCGLQPQELIVIAGRTSAGKTALALEIASHAAINLKKIVAVFSLEMSKEALMIRMICSEGRIDSHKLRTGFSCREDWNKGTTALGRICNSELYIDDAGDQTIMQLRAKARRHQAEKGLDLLMVDYLQLLDAGGSFENRVQEVSFISKSLKSIAKELKVPVVALSQLRRPPDQKSSAHRRPQLSDLRESGSIEQDADLVILIDKQKPKGDDPGATTLIVGKQRNGPTGDVPVVFLKPYGRFENSVNSSSYSEEPVDRLPYKD